MKPFVFELAAVYRIKEHERDQVRQEFANALEALRILEERQQELVTEVESVRERRKTEASSTSIDVDRIISAQRFEHVLLSDIKDVAEKVKMVQEELETRRLKLVEADREVKALDLLREKRRRAHEQLILKQEDRELDEVAARVVQVRKGD